MTSRRLDALGRTGRVASRSAERSAIYGSAQADPRRSTAVAPILGPSTDRFRRPPGKGAPSAHLPPARPPAPGRRPRRHRPRRRRRRPHRRRADPPARPARQVRGDAVHGVDVRRADRGLPRHRRRARARQRLARLGRRRPASARHDRRLRAHPHDRPAAGDGRHRQLDGAARPRVALRRGDPRRARRPPCSPPASRANGSTCAPVTPWPGLSRAAPRGCAGTASRAGDPGRARRRARPSPASRRRASRDRPRAPSGSGTRGRSRRR